MSGLCDPRQGKEAKRRDAAALGQNQMRPCGKPVAQDRPWEFRTPTEGLASFCEPDLHCGQGTGIRTDMIDEDDFAAGFVFNNPNAKGSCGCGESFTV